MRSKFELMRANRARRARSLDDNLRDLQRQVRERLTHLSDCALHNAPAFEPGSCDCGAQLRAERRWWAWLCCLARNQVARWRTASRSRSWRRSWTA